jgi:hypothetical protein
MENFPPRGSHVIRFAHALFQDWVLSPQDGSALRYDPLDE